MRRGAQTVGEISVAKPKRMRWETYYRELERADAYDAAAFLRGTEPFVERIRRANCHTLLVG